MEKYFFLCFAATGRWGEEGPGGEERRGEAVTTAIPAAVCGELCLNSYISSISFLPHASFEIYELLLPFNLFKCKNVLILLLLKVYEKYDYNSSICTSNDNKLAVTSFKIWLFHKLVPNLLHICYQISWTMQRVKCTFS